jgi:hypothetical protein
MWDEMEGTYMNFSIILQVVSQQILEYLSQSNSIETFRSKCLIAVSEGKIPLIFNKLLFIKARRIPLEKREARE